jgi:hypothetical protein
MVRLDTVLVVMALTGATMLSACSDQRPSSYDDRNHIYRAGSAAPTFNCQDRGTCGGPTAIPGTPITDSPGPRGNGRQ